MSPRPWEQRVLDIIAAIVEIAEFIRGLTLEQFSTDVKTQKAVVLNFVIIGEAARAIGDDVAATAPTIPWDIMRGMRNRLVHAYFAIDPQIVWETATNDLPALVAPLQAMLPANPPVGSADPRP